MTGEELQAPQERGSPAQTHNKLWNELLNMILEWEDAGADSAGDLATSIIRHMVASGKL